MSIRQNRKRHTSHRKNYKCQCGKKFWDKVGFNNHRQFCGYFIGYRELRKTREL